MSNVRRYDQRGGKYVEAPMDRGRPVASRVYLDEQHEIARKYYPNGQLEAERLRYRRRELPGRRGGDDNAPNFIADAIKYFILGCVLYGFAALGTWAFRGYWWGPFVGLGVVAVIAAAGKPND